MEEVLKIVQDETLTYHQQLLALARLAENFDHTIKLSDELVKAKEEGIICDLGEGNLPYRPRYIIPDYQKFINEGSSFLQLEPPHDLWEACNNLLIMYRHVPSITSFPVFLGELDNLLEPFTLKLSKEEAKKCLRLFLLNIDRTLTDSFVHADIGPKDTVTGRLILELTEEMQLAIPNLTLKYDPELTSDDFAQRCAICMMKTAKPSFANHRMFVSEWGEDYAIASCYNGLRIAGGGYTLARLRLYEMSLKANSADEFLNKTLPYYCDLMWNMMNDRICFIVEKSSFFKANFLATEGFVKQENFTGMFGMVGLAECVNHLLGIDDPKKGFGNNEEADQLGIKIVQKIEEFVNSKEAKYCESTNNRYRLHAQVGLDSDGRENSPGCRIPIGCEPEMYKQIAHSTLFHKYFPTGIGDIFKYEETWLKTPMALVDIIKGALEAGMRYYSGYLANNDVVRVTGYLVKKSELEKLDKKKQSLNNVSVFGKGARDFSNALDRRVHESTR
ncbi:YjjI family glycine radical enzyme [Traorella massiliensis]|uniref:YjjI family glycine radical enzyme n=1 Tax=Traorella massiliensis TaxID=1903263 RepID=UPI0023546753|nr:YjjI family glycine radical enzyme [Traorella massiliensis]